MPVRHLMRAPYVSGMHLVRKHGLVLMRSCFAHVSPLLPRLYIPGAGNHLLTQLAQCWAMLLTHLLPIHARQQHRDALQKLVRTLFNMQAHRIHQKLFALQSDRRTLRGVAEPIGIFVSRSDLQFEKSIWRYQSPGVRPGGSPLPPMYSHIARTATACPLIEGIFPVMTLIMAASDGSSWAFISFRRFS
jgi:hypothetical protein